MDKKFEALIDGAVEKFTMVDVEVKGVLVCDKDGLPLANKDVTVTPGPVARLAELATLLSGRRTTVCLEHNEVQVLVHQAEKAVVAVYTKHTT